MNNPQNRIPTQLSIVNIYSPGENTDTTYQEPLDILGKSFLTEEIDHYYNMNASEVERGLRDLGISTTPSDNLKKYIQNPNGKYLRTTICSKDKIRMELETIEKWLGDNGNLDRFSLLNKETLFIQADEIYKSIFRYYKLDPILTNIRDLIENKLINTNKSNDDSHSWGVTYVDTIVNRSLKKLKISHPEINNTNKKYLISWLREIARIPIKREILHSIKPLFFTKDYISNVPPEEKLYMMMLFLNSRNMKVLYCNYVKDTVFKKLQIYFSNGEGYNYHSYKQKIADKCSKLLESKRYINKAFLIDISQATIILPFKLFCVRAKKQQIIFIGISNDKNNVNIEVLVETLRISGFETSRDTIYLKQKKLEPGKIEFEKARFIISGKNLSSIKTNSIKHLLRNEDIIEKNSNIDHINDMVNAMKTSIAL